MTKTVLFDRKLQNTAAIFKALAHPARLAILKYLAEARVCISGDISEELPLSRTTVYQHLKELKKLNFIKGEIEGVKKNYCLNPEMINAHKSRLNVFFTEINCCNHTKC